jgi:hypothetical protein
MPSGWNAAIDRRSATAAARLEGKSLTIEAFLKIAANLLDR